MKAELTPSKTERLLGEAAVPVDKLAELSGLDPERLILVGGAVFRMLHNCPSTDYDFGLYSDGPWPLDATRRATRITDTAHTWADPITGTEYQLLKPFFRPEPGEEFTPWGIVRRFDLSLCRSYIWPAKKLVHIDEDTYSKTIRVLDPSRPMVVLYRALKYIGLGASIEPEEFQNLLVAVNNTDWDEMVNDHQRRHGGSH